MTYPFLIFRAWVSSFFSFLFSVLSNVICLCTAVRVCLWDEAAGMKPEMKCVDFVFPAKSGCNSRNFSIKRWPSAEQAEVSPAAFA